ncbi:hypothetical protein [Thalassolituus pacificus]|uniref:Uncharacterized protein n=1 Tax=Thalassolituus pacificus TaxID=2975440 RepID=A0A9X2WGS0_9GAMM|nr:hypothetical protein [Thalassolituus pacificus]MCT7360088.1 hypothetical protein [Thalassolituus pacificus]
MATPRTSEVRPRLLAVAALLLLPALLALHFGLVSVLLALGSSAAVSTGNNVWLSAADAISRNNPEVHVAIARYERQRAIITADGFRDIHLQESLARWQKAQQLRPLWPYYQLGAFDAEILLDAPAEVIQQRMNTLMTLAPNERGMDRSLLELALFGWQKLTPEQQVWSLERLDSTRYETRKAVLQTAARIGVKPVLCSRMSWKKVRTFCR